ncbi:MAG TPA: hypothetical protein VH986_07560 [Acidimicrobiia bacterium]
MTDARTIRDDPDEVRLVARGMATAVAPEDGLTQVQADLLGAIASALTGVDVDYMHLEPLDAEALAEVLRKHDDAYRRRIVHHMVLAELVLRPIPADVAIRVERYAKALGIDDQFVRVARRYGQGAYGLAWMDLRRSGFMEHFSQFDTTALRANAPVADPLEGAQVDPELEARWRAFSELPDGSLGRSVCEMYGMRGFALPGSGAGGPTPYLAQHDFVHVIADYGTNLKGELEVFAFIGRADPDPKGFAWLATLVGLFETGVISEAGFFDRDIRNPSIRAEGMNTRVADAIRRGKQVCEAYRTDLFAVDYHAVADRPVDEVREMLSVPAKCEDAETLHWPGLMDREGMSEAQQRYADAHGGGG